jgi:glyoxylase I family protein
MLIMAAGSGGARGVPQVREGAMPGQIPTGEIHHLRLTVTDLARSREFYTQLLGFEVAVEPPPADDPAAAEAFKILFGGVVMARGNLIMGLRPMAPSG